MIYKQIFELFGHILTNYVQWLYQKVKNDLRINYYVCFQTIKSYVIISWDTMMIEMKTHHNSQETLIHLLCLIHQIDNKTLSAVSLAYNWSQWKLNRYCQILRQPIHNNKIITTIYKISTISIPQPLQINQKKYFLQISTTKLNKTRIIISNE